MLRSALILCLLAVTVAAIPFNSLTFKFRGTKPVAYYDESPQQVEMKRYIGCGRSFFRESLFSHYLWYNDC
ncbi:hypothetical protein QR680_015943 [Steinernema hermaphroditum]|uniref:BPTI/Kunitz inhibitor domain-containing protein n=1 Tax=Steinernema hermaphroditum TaxID=289476 RepID=A0AA39HAF7_9BILA|nr:hypothetical protein QR680_015943 [Steinernema hermaphroditum]